MTFISIELLVIKKIKFIISFQKYQLVTSLSTCILLMVVSLLPYIMHKPQRELYTDLSSPAMFAISMEVSKFNFT